MSIIMKRVLFVLGFLLPLFGSATNFVVTNNNASGNGSLAQAVSDASLNGTTTTDVISFNLPVAQTTIPISSALVLSSNLIVDGTTQPGKAFGKTDSKIRLQAVGCTIGLKLDGVSNVEIYGLWLTDFKNSVLFCISAAITLRNTNTIVLGKPGKGNCFTNNLSCIVNPWQSSQDSTENVDITIQANKFAMDTAFAPDENSSNMSFGTTRKFLFGGDNPAEGNRIGNAFATVGNFFIPLSKKGDTIAFKNNFFGFDAFNGALSSTIGLYIAGYKASRSDVTVIIAGNKIGKDDATNKVWLTDISGNILIHDNYIGSLNAAVTPGENASAIYLENCVKKDSIIIRNNIINGYREAVLVSATKDVTITNNSIYCNQKGINYTSFDGLPIISLSALTSTYIKGSALPLNTIEIFTTNVCGQYCENGKTLVTRLLADANGVFEYSGDLSGTISITATSVTGTTSEFYGAKFTIDSIVYRNATCGLKNGFIKGIKIIKGNTFHWEDEAGNVVGKDTSLSNLGEGKYRFVVKDSLSSCPVYSNFFKLISLPKPSVDSTFSVVNTSCGKSLGQVILNGMRSAETVPYWQDSARNLLQVHGQSITGLPAGKYYYKLFLWEDTACYTNYGPFTILDKAGASLLTNNARVTPSNCGEANGSVTNITYLNASGTPGFAWEDSTGVVVAKTLDLTNVPGGKYRLKFKDESVCDTIVSPFFTVEVIGGIQIDSSRRNIRATSCTGNTGSITNLVVPAADYFEWVNVLTNQKVGTRLDLLQVPSGYYRLYTGNAIGCKDTSSIMFIPGGRFTPVTVQNVDQVQPHCDLANGSVKITGFSTDSSHYVFAWKDSVTGATLSNTSLLDNVNTGTYNLQALDTNGCTAKLLTIIMKQVGKPVIDLSQMKLQDDTCNQSIGRIKNLRVTGGQKPYLWQWYKGGISAVFANTEEGLVNLKQGFYNVSVLDSYQCSTSSSNIEISNYDKPLPAPLADNVSIPRNTAAELIIKNFSPGTYSLYDTITGLLPYRIINSSRLITPVVSYNKTFYIQYTLGTCVSTRQPVLVSVFDQSKLTLPNAFSPNGDGINDVFKIQVQGLITVKEWLIFNRYGQLIFSTNDGVTGWDGKMKNAYVPVGTYYWIVNATDNNGKEIKQQGSVTVLR